MCLSIISALYQTWATSGTEKIPISKLDSLVYWLYIICYWHCYWRGFNSLAPGRLQFNFRLVIFKLTLVNCGWGISYEIALRWMPLVLTDDKSTLVQVMAWCRQATSHYLNQCWPRSPTPYGVTRPQWVKNTTWNTLTVFRVVVILWAPYFSRLSHCFIAREPIAERRKVILKKMDNIEG